MEDLYGGYAPSERLVVCGEGEEANFLTATGEGADALVISDTGADLRPGRGCTSIDSRSVRCTFTVTRRAVYFDGGAGDDEIDASAYAPPSPDPPDASSDPGSIRGGPGADIIRTSVLGGYANGGPGSDRLIGGAGRDEFTDSDPPERDEFDGGGGVDRLNYFTRGDPLTIDLAAGVGGASGEGDRIVGIAEVTGGDGPDVLLGSDTADSLNGGEGDDRLDGRAGDDRLEGGVAPAGTHDVVLGGDGKDVLRAAPIGRATSWVEPATTSLMAVAAPTRRSADPARITSATGSAAMSLMPAQGTTWSRPSGTERESFVEASGTWFAATTTSFDPRATAS